MFDLFRKKKKEEPMATQDEKEIDKAKEDIAEKGKDSQTEKDREDESVGEQERRSGNEDSQSAKDRIDESEGTKRADEKRGEEKDDKRDDRDERVDKLISTMERFIAAVEADRNAGDREPKEASSKETDELKRIENLYN